MVRLYRQTAVKVVAEIQEREKETEPDPGKWKWQTRNVRNMALPRVVM
jgi:hypothetical protein